MCLCVKMYSCRDIFHAVWVGEINSSTNLKHLKITEPPLMSTLFFMCRQQRDMYIHVGRGKMSSWRLEDIWKVL